MSVIDSLLTSRIWHCWQCAHEWQASEEGVCDWCGADEPTDMGPAYPGIKTPRPRDSTIALGCMTKLDLAVDWVLEQAIGQISDDGVIVIGWDKNEKLYFASSIADGGDVLWLLEKCKNALLEPKK